MGCIDLLERLNKKACLCIRDGKSYFMGYQCINIVFDDLCDTTATKVVVGWDKKGSIRAVEKCLDNQQIFVPRVCVLWTVERDQWKNSYTMKKNNLTVLSASFFYCFTYVYFMIPYIRVPNTVIVKNKSYEQDSKGIYVGKNQNKYLLHSRFQAD